MITNNSIEDYREIVTDNPYREMWNQLYYFTDVDSVNKKVRSRFQLGGEYKEDTKKQVMAPTAAPSGTHMRKGHPTH